MMPCPKLKPELEIIGLVTKPNITIGFTDLNLEALFLNKDFKEDSEFFKYSYSLAKKKNLGFLTLMELDVLGKTPIDPNRKRFRFNPFEENESVLCPLNWVQEVRIIKKYCHRIYYQGFELSESFLRMAIGRKENYAETNFDKSKCV